MSKEDVDPQGLNNRDSEVVEQDFEESKPSKEIGEIPSPGSKTNLEPEELEQKDLIIEFIAKESQSSVEPGDSQVDVTDPETIIVERIAELETNLEEQKTRMALAERAVAIRRQRSITNREKRGRIQQDLAHLTNARDSLASWLNERSQSLALKLLAHIDEQEQLQKSEEKVIRFWAEAPIPPTMDTAANLRRKYIRGLWVSLFGAAIIPVLLFGLNLLLAENDAQVAWFEDTWWKYAILGCMLFVIFVSVGLTAYYRGYNRMKLDMDKRLARGRYLLGAADHIRSERARIEGLAPQVRDRLQFFGAVLQEPWRVPGYGGASEDSDNLKRGLPALLQIAKTAHANDPAIIKLRAQFTAEQYRIGMRRQAIDELIRAAAERQGIPSEQANLRAIDRDSSAYGLRSALLEMVRDPDVLELVGRSRVAEIAAHIQSGMTPSGERPGIALTNIDTLQGLSVSHDLLADWSNNQTSWDDYVAEILEDGAALSRLAFSPTGTAQSRHLKFQSIAVAPERLRESAGQLIEFVDVDSGVVTGTEIVARLDITQAMDVSDVALFDLTASESWSTQPESPATKIIPGEHDSYTL